MPIPTVSGDIGNVHDATGARLGRVLQETRGIQLADPLIEGKNILAKLQNLADSLATESPRESDAIRDVSHHCVTAPDFGGLGLSIKDKLDNDATDKVLFLVSSYLEALNYQDRLTSKPPVLADRPAGRRGMTLAEKIFAAHDVSRRGEVKPGDVIRLDIDWVIASELSWYGMEKTYGVLGKPGIFRNDRLWIAGDHVVDPRVMDNPKIKPLVESSERARKVFKLTEYQGMNYTIMHTEFCRERAQPGMLIVGSDSHTCSAGSVSSLAIGLGVADVTLPLVTGETWIKVPETVEIRFINKPKPGLGGKDIILYVLKELKRNTVAADKVVEYTGPGLQELSCDARFAICNMTTEFGGVTGICVPDATTKKFIDGRKHPKHRKQATYYRPDDDAKYAESYTIDLDKVESFVARYPSPDDVVAVCQLAGTKLDGCFIGACTTALEDLILGALVLKVGLDRGMKPVGHGKRKVVPGSRPIIHDLEERGFADIYRRAGFEIGVPGCSYCVGMSADKAGKGEVWLSSQNRNFENRMGPGAIGSITSAVTVAASSFDMTITDPASFLSDIDQDHLEKCLRSKGAGYSSIKLQYFEPGQQKSGLTTMADAGPTPTSPSKEQGSPVANGNGHDQGAEQPRVISGKVQTLGDFIDTDALAPAEALVGNGTPEELGQYCLYHTHPDFRRRVKVDGMDIVVAGKAFGVGSSRENAVTALQGAGVRCVIARSFAFIYARNQPNLGMLGIIMEDEDFYARAQDGVGIRVDVDRRVITLDEQEYPFTLSELEVRLWQQGGMARAFGKLGKGILEMMTAAKPGSTGQTLEKSSVETSLEW